MAAQATSCSSVFAIVTTMAGSTPVWSNSDIALLPAMTTTAFDLADARVQRAIPIAADAGQWLRCTRRDGLQLYGIPSQKRGLHYFTTRDFCSCPDQKFHPEADCKHMRAVQIFEAVRDRSNCSN
jgi:hypothetical protein